MKKDIALRFKNCFIDDAGNSYTKITDKELSVLRKHKLLKCFLPKEYGGLSLGLLDTLNVIEQCSYVNGSLGWLVQIGNGGSYFVTNLGRNVAKELYSPENAVLTGSGTPTGSAKKVKGGYEFTGFSKFCSGSDYATLFTATAFIEGSDQVITGIVPREHVQISTNWNPMGMKATSSYTSNFDHVFVPDDRVFQTNKRISHLDIPILNLPFLLFAQAFFISVVYGLIAHFLEEATCFLEQKRALWSAYLPKRILDVESFVLETNKLLSSAKSESTKHFLRLEKGEEYSKEDQDRLKNEVIEHACTLKNQIYSNFYLFGMDVLDVDHVMNIIFNDLVTVTQHQLLNK